jgi:hypothetical protein
MLGSVIAAVIGLRAADGRHVPALAKQTSDEIPVINLEPALGD